MKRSLIAAFIAYCLLAVFGPQNAHSAATLLPNGEQCFQAVTGINGMVGTLGTITGGSGGTAGTYGGVSLTGGSGSGATANITVSGGSVTAVVILNPGSAYVVGDTLSATSSDIGNVSGFSVPVASVSINSSVAGGTVSFYYPNTTTFKQTWQDSAQTILNTNPVTLDANGCAVIYGTGSYRQVLKDSLGNTVWDQVTADTSSYNNTFWAGNASGTPNAITVVDPGFNATDGSIINFIPISTNTGATTLNPSSFGAVSIVKDTTAGPIALTGGEIVAVTSGQPNVVSVIYSASQNNFHLLNTVIASASGASAPLCGASGLVITNDSGTPNSIITITADQALTQSPAGLVLNRSNVNVTINTTTGSATSTAGGMDGEAIASGKWVYIWLIDNGSAIAGLATLASGNGLTPNMPSGYTYKCRVGAMTTASGSSNLLRTIQRGQNAKYQVIGASTTTLLPVIRNGAHGSSCTGATPTYEANQVTGDTFVAPITATELTTSVHSAYNGTNADVLVSPNNDYAGGDGSGATNTPPCNSVSTGSGVQCTLTLESNSIYYCSSNTGGAVQAYGWKDKVNAN